MQRVEHKATEPIELSELDKDRRTAVIAHAVYDNIDKKKDIARRGMFTKSWKENKAIDFLIDHDKKQKPGLVIGVFDDEKKAYTKVKFGNHTLGNDTMLMMDDGIIKGASFGFITLKANKLNVKNQNVRELKEVLHLETTAAYSLSPINDLAGVVMVTKAMEMEMKALNTEEKRLLMRIVSSEQSVLEEMIRVSGTLDVTSDLYTWINWNISRRAEMMGSIREQLRYDARQLGELKAHAELLEKFCRDTTASDDCIELVRDQSVQIKSFISQYDTEATHLISEPGSSRNGNDSLRQTLLLINSTFDNG